MSEAATSLRLNPLTVRVARAVPYTEALLWQREAVRRLRQDRAAGGRVWLVEHTPVITCGRSGSSQDLLVDLAELSARGIDYHESRRGGSVTYHGPGQWTLYPVLRLEPFCKDLHRYLRLLEEVAIRFLARHGLPGRRRPGRSGVWVETPTPASSPEEGSGLS